MDCKKHLKGGKVCVKQPANYVGKKEDWCEGCNKQVTDKKVMKKTSKKAEWGMEPKIGEKSKHKNYEISMWRKEIKDNSF